MAYTQIGGTMPRCLLIAILLLSGCASHYYIAKYDFGLAHVRRSGNADSKYGEKAITEGGKGNSKGYFFEDKVVKILWTPSARDIDFTITNKTDSSIQIVWDEAAYVDENNKSHRVIHSGVKFNDRNTSQPPSVIAAKGSLDDNISFADSWYFVTYDEQTIYKPMGWNQNPMFPDYQNRGSTILVIGGKPQETNFPNQVKSYIGKQIKVVLPIKVLNEITEYTFIFDIKDVQILEQ